MEALLQQLSDWLKGMLVDGIMNNLSGMFDAVNQQVADVATGWELAGKLLAGGLRPRPEHLRNSHHSHRGHVPYVHRLL